MTLPSLISAQSSSYATLNIDPEKLIPAWNGMLPYIYTFNKGLTPSHREHASHGTGNGVAWLCAAAIRYRLRVRPFRFSALFRSSFRRQGLLQEIIPELIDLTPVDDPATRPLPRLWKSGPIRSAPPLPCESRSPKARSALFYTAFAARLCAESMPGKGFRHPQLYTRRL